MPRPRKNDPTGVINPIVEQFVWKIATAVERFTVARIERAVKEQAREIKPSGRRGRGAGRARGATLCYYPGCKNIAAPRFGMFCAALHKGLPKSEKEKYRAAHESDKAGPPRRGGKGRAAKGKAGRRAK